MGSPVTYRLNRLFAGRSGRCLDVAVDHGFFGEATFLRSIEDMVEVIDVLAAAAPDAIQLSVGQAPLLQERRGRDKPALVLRADVANIYGTSLPSELFSATIADPVDQAVRLDAVCIVLNLLDIPGQPGVRRACTENILAVKPACEAAGMPLMVEPLVLRPNDQAGGYTGDVDVERIVPLVRQAAELGADIIKADPTGDLDAYWRVVQAARVPLLVRGGGRVGDAELLARTRAVLDQGARGIVYGRNIIQHESPAGITAALMAMVHDDADIEQALAVLERRQ